MVLKIKKEYFGVALLFAFFSKQQFFALKWEIMNYDFYKFLFISLL